MTKTRDMRSYWEQRLTTHLDLRGTGHRAFGLEYNEWLYKAQLDCMDQLFAQHQIDLSGRTALDVGSGSGVYVDYLLSKGPEALIGIDIAEVSVAYLRQHYPAGRFYTLDIASQAWPFDDRADMITAISVLYHIVDDDAFEAALRNLCRRLRPGGYLCLSDVFRDAWQLTARHARLRDLAVYQRILANNGLRIVSLLPIYYYLNRTYVPVIGPWIIDRLGLGKAFYGLDRRLRAAGRDNGAGMKLLLARREGTGG